MEKECMGVFNAEVLRCTGISKKAQKPYEFYQIRLINDSDESVEMMIQDYQALSRVLMMILKK